MTKKTLKEEILMKLEDVTIGVTISSLAKDLNSSRSTITKYLKELKKEGMVNQVKVGDLPVWAITKPIKELNQSKQAYIVFVRNIIDAIQELCPGDLNWKEIGKHIGEHTKTEKLITTTNLDEIFASEGPLAEKMGKIALEVFKMISDLYDISTIDPPIIINRPPIIIIRIRKSAFISHSQIFDLTIGMLEQQVRKAYPIFSFKIDYAIKKKDNIIDFELKLQE